MGKEHTAKLSVVLAGLLILGCASGGDSVSKKLLENSNLRLQREVSDQQSELRRLRRFLDAERAEETVAESQSAGQSELDAKVPLTVLKPEAEKQEGDESDFAPGTKVLATSEHESLTWYQQGIELMRAEKFDQAVVALTRFLNLEPEHVYSDRAQFLIAENYYRNREYALAIVEDNRFLSRYPGSMKAPEVLYRAALSHLALGQSKPAKGLLRELLRQFPGDMTAGKASRKLAEISAPNRG